MRAFAVGLLLCLVFGCAGKTDEVAKPAVEAPRLVIIAPKKQTLTWTVEQPGTVMAYESAPIVAKLPGYITKVYVDLGDRVQGPTSTAPGTLLAELAIPELEQELQQKLAEVQLRTAEVTLAERGADVAKEHSASTEAMLTEAKAMQARTEADVERWTSEFKRIESLANSKVVDTQTVDETRKALKSATSQRGEVQARIGSAGAVVRESTAREGQAAAEVAAAGAKLQVANADAARLKALVGYTKITAPMSGVITGRYVHTGHFLQPGGARPEPLFHLAKLDTVRVVVDMPDKLADQAKAGGKATVKFPTLNNLNVDCTISRVSGALNAESRTLRVEIDLPNPTGRYTPGTYVVVALPGSSVEAITLPSSAVLFADETAYVYEIVDGIVRKLRVKTGRVEPTQVELLAKRPANASQGVWQPFTGTEQVVAGQLGALADGQPAKR